MGDDSEGTRLESQLTLTLTLTLIGDDSEGARLESQLTLTLTLTLIGWGMILKEPGSRAS